MNKPVLVMLSLVTLANSRFHIVWQPYERALQKRGYKNSQIMKITKIT